MNISKYIKFYDIKNDKKINSTWARQIDDSSVVYCICYQNVAKPIVVVFSLLDFSTVGKKLMEIRRIVSYLQLDVQRLIVIQYQTFSLYFSSFFLPKLLKSK